VKQFLLTTSAFRDRSPWNKGSITYQCDCVRLSRVRSPDVFGHLVRSRPRMATAASFRHWCCTKVHVPQTSFPSRMLHLGSDQAVSGAYASCRGSGRGGQVPKLLVQ
jgi:hypothetical protein